MSGFFGALDSRSLAISHTREAFVVLLAVYHLLLDDDEDVRNSVAAVASKLHLSTSTNGEKTSTIPLAPCVAASKIFEFLISRFNDLEILVEAAAYRFFGEHSLLKLDLIGLDFFDNSPTRNDLVISESLGMEKEKFGPLLPVEEMLHKVIKQDDALFAEEKQNLYIDPVQEADKWAKVLTEIDPSRVSASMMHEFMTWTTDGLMTLIRMAKDEENGPLSRTSKPDIFTLGTRVILAAKIQLHWMGQTKFQEAPSPVVKLLNELLEVGRRSILHEIWLRRIEDILEAVR